MIKEFITHSEQETISLAEELGKNARESDIFSLEGDLGTGKTVIAKGIARALGIKEEVTSPTFLMLEMYEGRLPLFHFDLYRINDPSELDQLSFEEYWDGNGISVIEWPENAHGRIPERVIKIKINSLNDTDRRIIIEYPGN